MKTYEIEITETMQKTVEVEAATPEDAYSKVREAWKNGGIILDADAFVDVSFGCADEPVRQAKEPLRKGGRNHER